MNRKYKLRDKHHGKSQGQYHYAGRWAWVRRIEPDYTFNRRKAPTETGYGVAYERNPAVNDM